MKDKLKNQFCRFFSINRIKWLLSLMLLILGSAGMAQDLVIEGATVYASPQSAPMPNAVVVVHKGKITQVGRSGSVTIPKNTRVIDAKGLYLTAGYWNCHVHFTESKWYGADTIQAARLTSQLNDMVNSRGFTHVFDLAELDVKNLKALRSRIDRGEVPGPEIRFVGVPLTPVNGSPFYIRPFKLPEVGSPSEAVKDVINQIHEGAQGIKLFTGSPNGKEVVTMRIDVGQAAVKAAHGAGLPVFAHPSSIDGVKVAMASGVDILAHLSPDDHRDWTQSTINELLEKHMAVIPTMKMFQWSLLNYGGDTTNNPLITTAINQLGSFAKAGGVILFGTDLGFMTDYSTEAEFELMSRSGLDFHAILKSLTTAPAKKFGLEKTTGRISAGLDADIVLLYADPAKNSRNFTKVAYTISKGKITYSRSSGTIK
jgi:imidazolonepropionase-like amidohydrolase